MSPEQKDFHSDEDFHADDEQDDYAPRSIFAVGWFRAVLVLTILAIVVVVALPYVLKWFEPLPSPVKESSRAIQGPEPAPAPAPGSASQPPQSAVSPPSGVAPHLPSAAVKPAPGKPGAATGPALPASPSRSAPAASAKSSAALQGARAGEAARRPERLAAGSATPGGARAEVRRSYWVQLGLFKDLTNAERLAKKLREQGFPVQVASVARSGTDAAAGGIPGGTYHLVRAGAFADRQQAVGARDELGARGYSGFLAQGAAK